MRNKAIEKDGISPNTALDHPCQKTNLQSLVTINHIFRWVLKCALRPIKKQEHIGVVMVWLFEQTGFVIKIVDMAILKGGELIDGVIPFISFGG